MSVLIYADTERSPALRHEIPLAIGDPFLYVEHDGRRIVLTNALESERIKRVAPDVETLFAEAYGMIELIAEGMPRDDAELEAIRRVLADVGVTAASVPRELPVVLADALRAAGIELTVDGTLFEDRRRIKNEAELAGIRRAQTAAEEALAAAERMLRSARVEGDGLVHDGAPLTAEQVRATIREVCASLGAPAPPDIMVASAWSGGGHEPGSGPLPANLPITIDLWPCDEQTACSADMTRTFVVGEVSEEVAQLAAVVREAMEAARELARPGVNTGDLYAAAAQVIEDAGYPTQRTKKPGETLRHGFYFGLGHGVGLEVHEAPGLGRSREHELVPGDVIAIEPGVEGVEGIGGVRFEDLLLITPDGSQTLTDYPYDL